MSFNRSNSQYSTRKKGTVKRFGPGPFGFIAGDDGSDYYVHREECHRVPGGQLRTGDRVSFETKPSKRDGEAAAFVRLA